MSVTSPPSTSPTSTLARIPRWRCLRGLCRSRSVAYGIVIMVMPRYLPLIPFILLAVALSAEDGTPSTLAVVKHWSDLLEQPVRDLGDGVHIRLGIETVRTTTGSVVLVYCLAEGFKAPGKGKGDNHLGPVLVDVTSSTGRLRDDAQSSWDIQDSDQKGPGIPLYAHPLSFTAPGTYTVTISTAAHGPLATSLIQVDAQGTTPWSSFGRAEFPFRDEPAEPNPADPAETVVSRFGFVGAQTAIPTCNGRQALSWFDPDMAGLPLWTLPTLMPPSTNPELQLHGDQSHLIVDSKSPMDVCLGDLPFLMRWWVNDRPWIPTADSDIGRSGGAYISNVHRVRFEVEILEGMLGARPGDRIGVQLLYCPFGWTVPGDNMAQPLLLPVTDEKPQPHAMISNRLDFVLP
jgi:hypothetical protein